MIAYLTEAVKPNIASTLIFSDVSAYSSLGDFDKNGRLASLPKSQQEIDQLLLKTILTSEK